MPERKLKCECNQKGCSTCYNREWRRKNYESFKKKYNENRRRNYANKLRYFGPLLGEKVKFRPVHVGFSTDLLLDKLTNSEVDKLCVYLGRDSSSAP